MKTALLRHTDAEVVFFLGDGISDIEPFLKYDNRRAWFAVLGNFDFRLSLPNLPTIKKTDEITLLGKRIVFTHGDLYGAKSGLTGLKQLAQDRSADIVLFGHTHVPAEEYVSVGDRAVWLFNPGSVGMTYMSTPSYGVITLEENKEARLTHCSLV